MAGHLEVHARLDAVDVVPLLDDGGRGAKVGGDDVERVGAGGVVPPFASAAGVLAAAAEGERGGEEGGEGDEDVGAHGDSLGSEDVLSVWEVE